MIKLLIGFVLGVIVTTIGFGGIATILDRAVLSIQKTSRDLAQ